MHIGSLVKWLDSDYGVFAGVVTSKRKIRPDGDTCHYYVEWQRRPISGGFGGWYPAWELETLNPESKNF